MLLNHQDKVGLFRKLVSEDRLSHAYLFYGDKGVGKFSFSKSLAYFLEYGEFNEGSKPLIDAKFMGAHSGTIGVDEARLLKRFVFQKPSKSPRRLAVIEDADCLTPEAQAALLKVAEDAPPHTTFIFITNDPQALLPPLASRLTKIYFKRISKPKVPPKVKEEDLAEELGRLIVSLYLKDKKKYSSRIAWLLNKHQELRRFNLNKNLQRKAWVSFFD